MSIDDRELIQRIRDEILAVHFPEMLEVEPKIKTQRSESGLRTLRRRGAVRAEEFEELPKERQVTLQLDASADRPFDRTVVIYTDDAGNPKFILESK